jgi:hypothetical protein
MALGKLRPSEFEGEGPNRNGIISRPMTWAFEKLRYVYRTGQTEEPAPDPNAEPNDWGAGGVHDPSQRL